MSEGTGEQGLQISNSLVGLMKEFFGKGPTKVRTYFAGPDLIVTVMGGGHTRVEQTLYESGRADAVILHRMAFQSAMEDKLREAVEGVTGRKVIAFMSASVQ